MTSTVKLINCIKLIITDNASKCSYMEVPAFDVDKCMLERG